MIDPPILNHIPTSPERLDILFDQHKIEEKCKILREPIKQNEMHEQFGCKKELIYFLDPENEDEIACIAEYNYQDPAKPRLRIILSLRIGTNVYKREIS
jgi:hypothetical protein